MNTLKITDLQADMLMHRLELPDVIAEVLEANEDAVQRVINGLTNDIKLKTLHTPSSELEADVLIEAVEGSTYVVAGESVESAQKTAAVQKSLESLAEKIETLTGKTVTV